MNVTPASVERVRGATRISFRGGGGSELWERAPRYYGPPVSP